MWKVGELAVKGVASVAQPPSPPVRKDTTNNVHKKTQTKAIERETPTVTENNVDTTTQARVWTLEEMRAAASTAAAAAGDSPKVQTETIPITFDSSKAGTPIVRKEEPSLPDSEEIKASSRVADEVDDKVIKMITPEPLTVSSTAKSKAKKPRRAKANVGGKGFSKK
eukprot:scaffold40260_cov139-Skeletonema_dohrnii-CCMP3373.AAC.1